MFMFRIYLLVITLCSLSLVSGCNKSNDEALVQIYPISQYSELKLDELGQDVKSQFNSLSRDGYKLCYKEFYLDKKENKVLLVYYRAQGSSHADSNDMVGLVLKMADSSYKWQIDKKVESLGVSGNAGSPPETKLVTIGINKYAILFQSGYANQGYGISYAELIAITDKGFVSCMSTCTGENNSGTSPPEWSYDMTINIVPSNKVYYDLDIKLTGTGDFKKNFNTNATIDKQIMKQINNNHIRLSYKDGKYI